MLTLKYLLELAGFALLAGALVEFQRFRKFVQADMTQRQIAQDCSEPFSVVM